MASNLELIEMRTFRGGKLMINRLCCIIIQATVAARARGGDFLLSGVYFEDGFLRLKHILSKDQSPK